MSKSRARPAETGTLIGLRMQSADLAALDAWRKKQKDLPSRPEAIRRLIAAALPKPPNASPPAIEIEDLNASNDE